MPPERFISSLQKHIATCYGDRTVSTLFYAQTAQSHATASRGRVHWQAAVLESEASEGQHFLHFYVGETDALSGVYGRTVPYMAPLAISGLDPEHRAFVYANGSVEVVLGAEVLSQIIAS